MSVSLFFLINDGDKKLYIYDDDSLKKIPLKRNIS